MKAENLEHLAAPVSGSVDFPGMQRIGSAQAQAVNQLYAASPVTFQMAGRTLTFQWRHAGEARGAPASRWPAIGVRLAGRLHLVHVEREDFLSKVLGLDMAALQPVARHALLAEAAKETIARMEQAMQGLLVLQEIDQAASGRALGARIGFVLSDQASGWRCEGSVRPADADGLVQLAALCEGWPRAEEPQADELASVSLRAVIGGCRLAIGELDGIVPGDLLLIDGASAKEGALRVRLTPAGMPGPSYSAILDKDEMTIMDADLKAHSADAAPGGGRQGGLIERLDDLEVNLSFELDEQVLTLRELRQLRPGHVLKLQQPSAQAIVRIRDGRRWLGHGQLLCVGDALGVRVVQFMQHGA